MPYYYNSGFSYVPFTSGYMPLQNQVAAKPQQAAAAETPKKENSFANKDLLWAGIIGLAVLGTYLITRGHYKAKIPAQTVSQAASQTVSAGQAAGQMAQEVAEQVAKPIPESVNTFLASYKPFSGVENVAEGVMPNITQVGSRTRAEFLTTVDGQPVRDIVIFNDKGTAVSRFLETTKPWGDNGIKKVRQAFRLNEKGEQTLVQTSDRCRGVPVLSDCGGRVKMNNTRDWITINNHEVNRCPEYLPNGEVGPNSNVWGVTIRREYDKTSGRLVYANNNRTYMNNAGDPIVDCFENERYFAYDKAGNLAGIFEKNPKKEFTVRKDYVYHTVENGQIVSSRKANEGDRLILRSYNDCDRNQIEHTLSDDEIANFADYFSSGIRTKLD